MRIQDGNELGVFMGPHQGFWSKVKSTLAGWQALLIAGLAGWGLAFTYLEITGRPLEQRLADLERQADLVHVAICENVRTDEGYPPEQCYTLDYLYPQNNRANRPRINMRPILPWWELPSVQRRNPWFYIHVESEL